MEVITHSTDIFGNFDEIYLILTRVVLHHLQRRSEYGDRLKAHESAVTLGLTAYRDHCLDRNLPSVG